MFFVLMSRAPAYVAATRAHMSATLGHSASPGRTSGLRPWSARVAATSVASSASTSELAGRISGLPPTGVATTPMPRAAASSSA